MPKISKCDNKNKKRKKNIHRVHLPRSLQVTAKIKPKKEIMANFLNLLQIKIEFINGLRLLKKNKIIIPV